MEKEILQATGDSTVSPNIILLFSPNARSSPNCTRFFCKTCGTHVYISYDAEEGTAWSGEIHFPTAILTEQSLADLERVRTGRVDIPSIEFDLS
jgi:hypothetical protein